MAPKKTTKPTPTPKTDSEPISKTAKKDSVQDQFYKSGDISRLSIILAMLAVTFIVGLLLGLGLGADQARVHVAEKIERSNLEEMLDENTETNMSDSMLEESTPTVPTPEPETPSVEVSNEANLEPTETETTSNSVSTQTTDSTVEDELDQN